MLSFQFLSLLATKRVLRLFYICPIAEDPGVFSAKKKLEVTLQVSDRPITTSVIVMVRRAENYKHVPVVGDMKYNESEGQ